jgi:hypothetical protein
MRAFVVVIVLSVAVVSLTAASQSQGRSREAVVRGLGRGESSAVVEAEQSGDRTLVPFIVGSFRIAKQEGRLLSTDYVVAARHAIVALADRRQLQEIWCGAVQEHLLQPDAQSLGIVGGWFGIRGLQELLKPERDKNFERAIRQSRSSGRDLDITYRSSQELALIALSETVPNSPVTQHEAAFGPSGPLVNKWNEWIAAHRAELEKLEPTGEGVDYAESACKNGKPVGR